MNEGSANKRVAKNTLFLYGRMVFLTLISLYTVRVTLNVLGVIDYGIYNVVGSVIAMLSILTGTLTSATQRYLSYHLGRKDYDSYSRTYSLLLICFIIIAICIIIISEIIGLFIFDGALNIPADRVSAAKIVYQTIIGAFIIHLITVPFSSSIIANERMSAFAYVSIIDGVLKLAIVFLLLHAPWNKLIVYSLLMLAEAFVILFCYIIYCKYKFSYCKIRIIWDRTMFQELSTYTGWNLLGALSGVLNTQGQNILLNISFGPVVNAAKAIGDKVFGVVSSLSTNFYMAVSPQIIKAYASDDLDRMRVLAVRSSKISFILIYIISLPLICFMKHILVFWLGTDAESEEMAGFASLSLICCLVACLEAPITQMIRATGNLKRYQIYVSSFMLCYIPFAWLWIAVGGSPLTTMYSLIITLGITQFVRVKIASRQVGLSIPAYFRQVILPIIYISAISIPLYIAACSFPNAQRLLDLGFYVVMMFMVGIIVTWTIGLSKKEKEFVTDIIKRRFLRKA